MIAYGVCCGALRGVRRSADAHSRETQFAGKAKRSKTNNTRKGRRSKNDNDTGGEQARVPGDGAAGRGVAVWWRHRAVYTVGRSGCLNLARNGELQHRIRWQSVPRGGREYPRRWTRRPGRQASKLKPLRPTPWSRHAPCRAPCRAPYRATSSGPCIGLIQGPQIHAPMPTE